MIQFTRQTVYALKRDYGARLELYTLTGSTVDLETGSKTVAKLTYVINQAILLPKRIVRDFAYDLSFVAANKNFTYGGLFDKGSRTVIIDSKDYPVTYVVKPGDYAVINQSRYNVKDVNQFDHRQIVLITLEEIEGEKPAQVISKKTKHDLFLGQMVVGVL